MDYSQVTEEMLMEALNKAVGEKGSDYVYRSPMESPQECLYAYDGEPSCIWGHALSYVGVPLTDFAELEGEGIGVVLRALGFNDLEEDFLTFADRVQGFQDSGSAWGWAIAESQGLSMMKGSSSNV